MYLCRKPKNARLDSLGPGPTIARRRRVRSPSSGSVALCAPRQRQRSRPPRVESSHCFIFSRSPHSASRRTLVSSGPVRRLTRKPFATASPTLQSPASCCRCPPGTARRVPRSGVFRPHHHARLRRSRGIAVPLLRHEFPRRFHRPDRNPADHAPRHPPRWPILLARRVLLCLFDDRPPLRLAALLDLRDQSLVFCRLTLRVLRCRRRLRRYAAREKAERLPGERRGHPFVAALELHKAMRRGADAPGRGSFCRVRRD